MVSNFPIQFVQNMGFCLVVVLGRCSGKVRLSRAFLTLLRMTNLTSTLPLRLLKINKTCGPVQNHSIHQADISKVSEDSIYAAFTMAKSKRKSDGMYTNKIPTLLQQTSPPQPSPPPNLSQSLQNTVLYLSLHILTTLKR